MNHVTAASVFFDRRSGDVSPSQSRRHGDPVYRGEFAIAEHSARHLRRILRLYLKGWELLAVAEAAELALTELIANVVRHVPDRRCQTLIILLPEGGVRVEVTDGGPELPRPVTDGDLLAEGGRGLVLLDAVTDAWGVEERPVGGGKTVWFECLAAGRTADTGGYLAESSASTASVNGVHASAAHGPKARSVRATQAAPATGSIQKNVPD